MLKWFLLDFVAMKSSECFWKFLVLTICLARSFQYTIKGCHKYKRTFRVTELVCQGGPFLTCRKVSGIKKLDKGDITRFWELFCPTVQKNCRGHLSCVWVLARACFRRYSHALEYYARELSRQIRVFLKN